MLHTKLWHWHHMYNASNTDLSFVPLQHMSSSVCAEHLVSIKHHLDLYDVSLLVRSTLKGWNSVLVTLLNCCLVWKSHTRFFAYYLNHVFLLVNNTDCLHFPVVTSDDPPANQSASSWVWCWPTDYPLFLTEKSVLWVSEYILLLLTPWKNRKIWPRAEMMFLVCVSVEGVHVKNTR